ncbi:MAG: 4'-phosphopantetheinyl transferase superfamily protein [Flavobacteriales bacterium]|nr:4'-phosphopantetheinyl transferase superfamily protein [Flavobacteriales bacterium]
MFSREIELHCSPTERTALAGDLPRLDAGGEVQLLFATLTACKGEGARLLSVLDEDERARAARFRFAEDRERFVLGHGLLRDVLAGALPADPASIRFVRGPHGKPYIEGAPMHFNFSDTKDAVLVGTAQGLEIGVDLETLHRRVDHKAVAGHHFTPAEVDELNGIPGEARKRRFLELWTRKEAVLKASGVGIMDDLKEMRVLDGANPMRITHPAFSSLSANAYYVKTFMIGDTHLVSVAASSPFTVKLAGYRAGQS